MWKLKLVGVLLYGVLSHDALAAVNQANTPLGRTSPMTKPTTIPAQAGGQSGTKGATPLPVKVDGPMEIIIKQDRRALSDFVKEIMPLLAVLAAAALTYILTRKLQRSLVAEEKRMRLPALLRGLVQEYCMLKSSWLQINVMVRFYDLRICNTAAEERQRAMDLERRNAFEDKRLTRRSEIARCLREVFVALGEMRALYKKGSPNRLHVDQTIKHTNAFLKMKWQMEPEGSGQTVKALFGWALDQQVKAREFVAEHFERPVLACISSLDNNIK